LKKTKTRKNSCRLVENINISTI